MTIDTTLYLDELDERDSAPIVTRRTAPLFPTAGHPVTGESWSEFFKRVKAPAEPVEAEPVEPEKIAILEPAHEVPLAALSARSTPAQVAKRLIGQGWEVRVSQSRVAVPAVLYVADGDDYSAGDVRYEAHELATTVLVGVKRGDDGRVGLALDATWTSKDGFAGAKTYDPILGREWRSGYRAPRKPNEIELEDGIQPPASLEQWLNMVAPKPVRKKKGEVDG
jgi:hypothetical protein